MSGGQQGTAGSDLPPEQHPYTRLNPDRVLDAVQAAGWMPDGRLLALNSYENRVYQVGIDDGSPSGGYVVAKFYRPERWSDAALREEHDFALALAAAEIPVVAPLRLADGDTLASHEGFRFAVYPRRGGRSPELDDPDVLQWIGRFLGRIHAVGASADFQSRTTLDLTLADAARATILGGTLLPAHLKKSYDTASSAALEGARAAQARAGTVSHLRLHGDTHVGNILWTDAGPHFVDLDDACQGPAIQDLWMLLSGDRADMSLQLSELLSGYEDFHDFDRRELHLIEVLRTVRMLHHAAWLARRWNDPAFPSAFPWFASEHYWLEHVANLQEQVTRMAQPPLMV